MGLFAFGDVILSPLNLIGLALNTAGVTWYAVIKAGGAAKKTETDSKRESMLPLAHVNGNGAGYAEKKQHHVVAAPSTAPTRLSVS